jgi:NADH:ubiquinone oxidoreductase subunit 5 (subunit L)/multisubunit Na+/H+ antiporter MnhA subunit
MKIKKSNGWIVLSNLIGYIGVGVGLLICAAVAALKLAGYEVSVPVPWVDGMPKEVIAWRHFLYAGIAIAAVIVVAVIFRLIGNAVYKKKQKKALEEARKAEEAKYTLDPETQEMLVATAKKVIPVVAAVAVTVVVVKAVKKSQARRRMEEMRMSPRYYY